MFPINEQSIHLLNSWTACVTEYNKKMNFYHVIVTPLSWGNWFPTQQCTDVEEQLNVKHDVFFLFFPLNINAF